MEKLNIPEQDIINALCVYTAHKKQIDAEQVQAELIFDDDYGFSAEVYWADRKQVLITSQLIEAIRMWLREYVHEDPLRAIELKLDDEQGIIAIIG